MNFLQQSGTLSLQQTQLSQDIAAFMQGKDFLNQKRAASGILEIPDQQKIFFFLYPFRIQLHFPDAALA